MIVKEPQTWTGQLVPWWLCKEDGDNWAETDPEWSDQHEPEAN